MKGQVISLLKNILKEIDDNGRVECSLLCYSEDEETDFINFMNYKVKLRVYDKSRKLEVCIYNYLVCHIDDIFDTDYDSNCIWKSIEILSESGGKSMFTPFKGIPCAMEALDLHIYIDALHLSIRFRTSLQIHNENLSRIYCVLNELNEHLHKGSMYYKNGEIIYCGYMEYSLDEHLDESFEEKFVEYLSEISIICKNKIWIQRELTA